MDLRYFKERLLIIPVVTNGKLDAVTSVDIAPEREDAVVFGLFADAAHLLFPGPYPARSSCLLRCLCFGSVWSLDNQRPHASLHLSADNIQVVHRILPILYFTSCVWICQSRLLSEWWISGPPMSVLQCCVVFYIGGDGRRSAGGRQMTGGIGLAVMFARAFRFGPGSPIFRAIEVRQNWICFDFESGRTLP